MVPVNLPITYDVIDVNECFHDFMLVNSAPHPPPPPPASVNLVLQHGAKPCKVSIALFVDYSYYSSTIRGLFVLFVDYSRTIRTIRRLFADYSHYSSTIRRLFVLFVDYSHYSHYSLHYSSFINCRYVTDICHSYMTDICHISATYRNLAQ